MGKGFVLHPWRLEQVWVLTNGSFQKKRKYFLGRKITVSQENLLPGSSLLGSWLIGAVSGRAARTVGGASSGREKAGVALQMSVWP